MKTAVRNQLRDHEGRNTARKAENRRLRRQGRVDLAQGYEPQPFRRSLERVLV